MGPKISAPLAPWPLHRYLSKLGGGGGVTYKDWAQPPPREYDQAEIRNGGRGGRGSGTQEFVYQKWPNQIFPIVNFVFSHWSLWSGGGVGGAPSMVVGRSNVRLSTTVEMAAFCPHGVHPAASAGGRCIQSGKGRGCVQRIRAVPLHGGCRPVWKAVLWQCEATHLQHTRQRLVSGHEKTVGGTFLPTEGKADGCLATGLGGVRVVRRITHNGWRYAELRNPHITMH